MYSSTKHRTPISSEESFSTAKTEGDSLPLQSQPGSRPPQNQLASPVCSETIKDKSPSRSEMSKIGETAKDRDSSSPGSVVNGTENESDVTKPKKRLPLTKLLKKAKNKHKSSWGMFIWFAAPYIIAFHTFISCLYLRNDTNSTSYACSIHYKDSPVCRWVSYWDIFIDNVLLVSVIIYFVRFVELFYLCFPSYSSMHPAFISKQSHFTWLLPSSRFNLDIVSWFVYQWAASELYSVSSWVQWHNFEF